MRSKAFSHAGGSSWARERYTEKCWCVRGTRMEFNCRTGSSEYDESLKIEKVPVKIENGDILISVPYSLAASRQCPNFPK